MTLLTEPADHADLPLRRDDRRILTIDKTIAPDTTLKGQFDEMSRHLGNYRITNGNQPAEKYR